VVITAQNLPKEPQAGNMFERLRERLEKYQSGQKENFTELGKKMIGGRKAIGYSMDVDGFPMTIWADAQTKLPLTIDTTVGSSESAVTMSMTDFAWGVPVDEKLFSLVPPKDYTVQESTFDVSNPPTEQDLIQMFRTWSSHMDGALPAKVDITAYFDVMKPLIKSVKLKATKGQDREPTTQEVAAIQDPAVKVARGIKFVMALPPASDWHYIGKGIKLNAPNTAIAWYRPQKSETYRVIYADMTVKDLSPDQLPKGQQGEVP
jgi:hypothetical protein